MARRAGVDVAIRQLREVLPDDWKATVARGGPNAPSILVTSPDGVTAELEVTSLKDSTPALGRPARAT